MTSFTARARSLTLVPTPLAALIRGTRLGARFLQSHPTIPENLGPSKGLAPRLLALPMITAAGGPLAHDLKQPLSDPAKAYA